MDELRIAQDMLDFIQKSPSMFHSTHTIATMLDEAGFMFLNESQNWEVEKGGKYYTTRNGSSIIAFEVGKTLEDYHFQLAAAHGDSPTFKIKSKPTLKGPEDYVRINVEAYGGIIDMTWFDRPLGIAGRVLVDEGDKVTSRLLFIDEDILIIPNVAIHMNREVNDGYKTNRQVDLLPMFSTGALKEEDFDRMIAEYLDVKPEEILARDLFVVNRQHQSIWGFGKEFVSSPRLDDMQCAFSALKGFLEGANDKAVNVYACFDNEEVGSNTKQGAMSTFLQDTLMRLNDSLGMSKEDYHTAVAKSFLVSCDNAHAVHPNHADLTDDANRSFMNKGIVIKESANQKYTSDAFSQAVFKKICTKADVPFQHFANRSNMQGGSTLGNLSNTQVSLHAVDIGLPQLAMHSSYETCGSKDTAYAVEALRTFFRTNIRINSAFDFELE